MSENAPVRIEIKPFTAFAGFEMSSTIKHTASPHKMASTDPMKLVKPCFWSNGVFCFLFISLPPSSSRPYTGPAPAQ